MTNSEEKKGVHSTTTHQEKEALFPTSVKEAQTILPIRKEGNDKSFL